MEWWLIITIAFGGVIFLFCLGIPIAITFLAIDIVGFYLLLGSKGLILMSGSIFESVGSFALSPVPLFILLGEVFYQSEVVNIAFDTIDKWVGGIRARLHIVTLVFATIFGAISGAGMAMAAMLGRTVLPEMVRRGYDKKLGMGVILGGGCLDPLIPPSILAVLIGSLANVSIAKLLISGIGPGLFLAVMLIVFVIVYVRIRPQLAPLYVKRSTLKEKILSLFYFMPFVVVILVVLGLMLAGFATPTESAGVGVVVSMIFAACYRKLSVSMIKRCVFGAIRVSAMVLFIVAGAKAFSQVLAISGGTRGLVEAVIGLGLSHWSLFAVMQIIPLFLGCFLDQIAIMLIVIPVYLPLIATSGFDPIWFWCLFLISMTVGGITPPFGYMLFTLQAAALDTRLEEVYSAAVPMVIIVILCMFLVTLFPQIALWLPSMMR